MRFDDDTPIVGGERLTGWELREVLDRLAARKILLAVPIAVKLTRDACRDLAGRTTHIGVSPRNLFVTADGRMRLLDVCLTRKPSDPRVRMASHGYLAPEQIDGGIVDQRTDIFALGAVLYELLSGKPLLLRNSAEQMLASLRTNEIPAPVRFSEHLDPTLVGVVTRMTQRAPQQRYQHAADISRDLDACLATVGAPSNADVADAMARLIGASPMSRWVDDLARPVRASRPKPKRAHKHGLATAFAFAITGAVVAAYFAAPSLNSAGSELPRTELPRTEPPKTELPKTELPKTEPPRTDLPKPELPKTAPPHRHLPNEKPRPPDPSIGHLSLDSQPLANVYLGDRLLGATPLVGRELPSGLTPLRLVDPVTGREQTLVIDIPGGGEVHRRVRTE